MNSKEPRVPMTGTAPRAGGPGSGPALSLQDQARDIIQAVLIDPDPQAASVKARLRSLLAAHPDDHVAVLREHLILTRSLTRAPWPAPGDGTGIAAEPGARSHS